jgi:hypothetical protein
MMGALPWSSSGPTAACQVDPLVNSPIFNDDDVFPAHFGQMIGRAAADDAASDNYDLGAVLHGDPFLKKKSCKLHLR